MHKRCMSFSVLQNITQILNKRSGHGRTKKRAYLALTNISRKVILTLLIELRSNYEQFEK